MSIFKLTDISFNKNPFSRSGDSKGNLVGAQYNSNTFKYPIDLGSYDKGHYMVIHINEQLKTSYAGPASSDIPTIFSNRQNLKNQIGTNFSTFDAISNVSETLEKAGGVLASAVQKGKEVVGAIGSLPGGTTSVGGSSSYRPALDVRTIRRTTDTIALYMPDTLNFTHQQNYSDISLGGGLFATAGAALSAVQGSTNMADMGQKILKNASPFVLYGLSRLAGDIGAAAFAGGFGAVANPQLELLYSSPSLRSFRFDFMFYPRSTKEAIEVQRILDRLRFHQAPEILGAENIGGLGGFFLVPPSEFDIKFFYNGMENPNIPKISTCVLTNLDIDYAPNGFSTYEIPTQPTPRKGQTGMPVAIRLSMEFKETEMLTKSNFSRDAGRASKQEIKNEFGGVYGLSEGE